MAQIEYLPRWPQTSIYGYAFARLIGFWLKKRGAIRGKRGILPRFARI
jgi:hypothetical protein